MQIVLRKRILIVALSGLVFSMLAACLWPFEVNPRNNVTWLKGESGLRFSESGMAVSRDAFPPLSRLSADGSLSIEFVLRPSKLDSSHLPYIIAFSPETGSPALAIGSWKKSLIVRLGRPGNARRKKYQEIGLRDTFATGKIAFVTVVAGGQGFAIYVDGILRREYPGISLSEAAVPLGRLVLGNSPTGTSDLQGDVLSMSIYNRALTADEVSRNFFGRMNSASDEPPIGDAVIARYRFDEGAGTVVHSGRDSRYDLLIPAVFKPLQRTLLSLPYEDGHLTFSSVLDVILNILGFVPFGFLSMLTLRASMRRSERTRFFLVVAAGFGLSLAIELVQSSLPSRSSDLVDLCTNTVGSALGSLIFLAVLRNMQRPQVSFCDHHAVIFI